MAMPSSSPTIAADPRQAAVAASLGAWLWRRVRRAWLVVTALCMAIALLLSALFQNDNHVAHVVYSFSIGYSCWICTDGMRLLLAAVQQRKRLRQGLAPATTGAFTSWRVLMPLIVVGSSIGLPLGLTLADRLVGTRSPSLLQWDSPNTRITLVVTAVAALFMFFAMSTLERLAASRVAAEAARAQASQIELKLLQSQLEPHMLFNTLANLRVLIGMDAARAQQMLDHLIAFLRATLNASRIDAHPLATEFARIGEYLALMGMRMGERLHVSLYLPAELAAAAVPPLILQPLVENAIRHGLEPKVGAARLVVSAERVDARLRLTVEDDGVGLNAAAGAAQGTRFGLQQVRDRLRTLYGERAQLVLQPCAHGQGALARIELPWPTTPTLPTTSTTSTPLVADSA